MTRRQARNDVTTSSPVPPRLSRSAQPARRTRALALTALVAAGTLTLGGCQWTSTVQTERQYVPADGWSAQVGGLDLRNLLVVATEKGGPGNVVGLAVNTGTTPIDVTVTGASGDKMTVAPNGTEQFTVSGGRTTTLPSVDAAPGGMTTLHLTTSAGASDVRVPVVAPNTYYATLAPSAAPSGHPTTQMPTASPTDGATAAPAPAATETTAPETPGAATPAPTGTSTAG